MFLGPIFQSSALVGMVQCENCWASHRKRPSILALLSSKEYHYHLHHHHHHHPFLTDYFIHCIYFYLIHKVLKGKYFIHLTTWSWRIWKLHDRNQMVELRFKSVQSRALALWCCFTLDSAQKFLFQHPCYHPSFPSTSLLKKH